jgi:hypothetical protein
MTPNASPEPTFAGMELGEQAGLAHHPSSESSAIPVPPPHLRPWAAQPIAQPSAATLEMLRALLYGLTVLHLGPGIAFALLAFGCEEPTPYLGPICGESAVSSFAQLAAVAWLILLIGLGAAFLVQRARSSVQPNIRVRALALLAVLAAGAVLAGAAVWLTGSHYGFLAIPGSLAVGWLFLANPLACAPEPPGGQGSTGHHGAA